MSTGAAWGSAVLIKGKEDPLSEFGHANVISQSDGEPASAVAMRIVQSKRCHDAQSTV